MMMVRMATRAKMFGLPHKGVDRTSHVTQNALQKIHANHDAEQQQRSSSAQRWESCRLDE
eukprot:NODE_10325_length_1360_cov_5.284672.p8 GENE.NODE_10325_length_1360_cov_5.284672~~NODE_10325_length_1360_cov_5.284672.p8  ORF type:complete len:60 (+),score=5.07 NODE_10325_length_1360_cov_5.284672:44-223(+)